MRSVTILNLNTHFLLLLYADGMCRVPRPPQLSANLRFSMKCRKSPSFLILEYTLRCLSEPPVPSFSSPLSLIFHSSSSGKGGMEISNDRGREGGKIRTQRMTMTPSFRNEPGAFASFRTIFVCANDAGTELLETCGSFKSRDGLDQMYCIAVATHR